MNEEFSSNAHCPKTDMNEILSKNKPLQKISKQKKNKRKQKQKLKSKQKQKQKNEAF